MRSAAKDGFTVLVQRQYMIFGQSYLVESALEVELEAVFLHVTCIGKQRRFDWYHNCIVQGEHHAV